MMRTGFSIFLMILFFACNDNKAEKAAVSTSPPEYYFYPKANVYFDSVNKDYVFLSNNGKAWESQKQIPAAMHALMDKNVFISSPAQPVWKDNEKHKLIYSALLYASPSDTQAAKVV